MNTINNTFSFRRFAAVLMHDLVENRKRYIGVFFVMFIAFLVFQLSEIREIAELGQIFVRRDGQFHAYEKFDYIFRFVEGCTPFFYGVLSLALMCGAADMCGVPMGNKGRSTRYMMMPATNFEKFLSRALINTILLIAMAYVALFCADLMRMLCEPFFSTQVSYGFTVPTIFVSGSDPFVELYKGAGQNWGTVEGVRTIVGFNSARGVVAACWLGVIVLYLHSLFMLGGCIWRKAAIIKTLVIGLAVIFITVWLAEKFNFGYLFTENCLKWYFSSDITRVLTCSLLLLPIFNWWLSYRLFSRKQVVSVNRIKLFKRRKEAAV